MLHFYIMIQELTISQLAIFHLQYLHASECQGKYFILPNKTLHSAEQICSYADSTGPGRSGSTRTSWYFWGADYCKSTGMENCLQHHCSIWRKEQFGAQKLFAKRENQCIAVEAKPASRSHKALVTPKPARGNTQFINCKYPH